MDIRKVKKLIEMLEESQLNEIEIKKGIQLCFQNRVYPGSKTPVFLINKKIINQKRPFKIVCLFRDPLERNISAFFDAFKLYTGTKPNNYNSSLKKLKEGFKQVYGASVFVFLLDYKMQASKTMLSSGNYNVNEVALKVGYSTATHFINAFKKKFGTTPKKYLMSL